MKKFLFTFFMTLTLGISPVLAQKHVLESTTPLDNWFISGNIGAIAPQGHSFDFSQHGVKSYRFETGLEIGKWLTPIIGVSLSNEVTVNTTPSYTAFDENDLLANLHINLSNLFCKYNGSPRWFEIELIPALGWKHYYGQPSIRKASIEWVNYYNAFNTLDVGLYHNNYVDYRAAIALDLNLSDNWQLNITPSINYFNRFRAHTGKFDLRVGLTYKIRGGNSNSHNFVIGTYYLENTYNDLVKKNNRLIDENKILINELKKCQETQPKTIEKIVKVTDNNDVVIGFEKGSTDLSTYSLLLKKIADKIKLTDKNVIITGYASIEGSYDLNSRLASQRANLVASELIENYNVPENKIFIINGETTSQFGENYEMNRVVIIRFDK